jgi:hypothetical protein
MNATRFYTWFLGHKWLGGQFIVENIRQGCCHIYAYYLT